MRYRGGLLFRNKPVRLCRKNVEFSMCFRGVLTLPYHASATKSVTVVDTISTTVTFYFPPSEEWFLRKAGLFLNISGHRRDVRPDLQRPWSEKTGLGKITIVIRIQTINYYFLYTQNRPWLGVTPDMDGFPLSPRDIEDRKDKIEQARSSRIFFCRPGPVFHCFHSLVVIFFPYRNRERCSSTRWGLPAVCTLFLKISIPYGADKQ